MILFDLYMSLLGIAAIIVVAVAVHKIFNDEDKL